MKFDLGHINKIAVINVVLNESQPIFHFLILKKVKDEIAFIKRGEQFRDLPLLVKKLSTQYPVLLHFTGKGILNRKTIFQENYHHSILLNANIDAFYFTDYREDNTVFSSVIRKDTVAEIVQAFETLKIQVVSISSGPFICAMLNQVLTKDHLTVDQTTLFFENNNLVSFEKSIEAKQQPNASFVLGNEKLNQNLLPCAAIGATFFNPDTKISFPTNDRIFIGNKEEARQKNIFARFGMGMMVFFLMILFGNHLYTGHLNQILIDNSVYLSVYDEQLASIADLQDEKNRKETLLQSSGLLNRRFLSFYMMELANTTPSTITFSEIIIRPLTDEIKLRQKIGFEEHLILINGQAESSHVLSRWIEKIESKEWLEKVDILSYEYVKNVGVFELELVVL